MSRRYFIYKIEHKDTGKCYIGKSINPKHRWQEHRKAATLGKQHPLYDALRKYGFDAFNWSIILETTEDLVNEQEKAMVAEQSYYPRGYNLAEGGTGGNTKKHWTEEQLQSYKDKHPSKKKLTGRTALSQKGKHITEMLTEEQAKKWRENYKMGVEKTSKRRREGQYTEAEVRCYEEKSEKMQGANNPRAAKVRCLETEKIYETVKQAAIAHGYKSTTKIRVSYKTGKATSDGYTFEKIK
jgi:group I intron endonuclease